MHDRGTRVVDRDVALNEGQEDGFFLSAEEKIISTKKRTIELVQINERIQVCNIRAVYERGWRVSATVR